MRGRGNARRTVSRAGLALAVVAVVVAREQRGVDVDRVRDGLAEAVSGETHLGRICGVGLGLGLGLAVRDARRGICGSGVVEEGNGTAQDEAKRLNNPELWWRKG